MNDYSEMAHGEACLRYCLYENPEIVSRSRNILDSVIEGLHDRAAQWFMESAPMRRAFTYLLSISEHGPLKLAAGVVDEESTYGRLSMWRAYGACGGVALIFNQDALMTPTNVLNVYSSPVFYGNPDAFAVLYCQMLSHIQNNLDQLKQIDPELFFSNLQQSIHFASLTCKHPGFAEEREWRVTYSADPANEELDDDTFNSESKIKRQFLTVNGLPQRIYKVPFVNYPEQGVVGLTLPEILKQVVIGPTQYPLVVADAVHVALRRAGFNDDNIRMAISRIPIRT